MTTAASIQVDLIANTAKYRQSMVDAARVTTQQVGRIQQDIQAASRSMENFKRAAVGLVSVQVLRSGASALLEVTKQNQALVNSMKASAGSAELAADSLAFVSKTARELGLDYQSAAEGFQRMTASATANGIAMRQQQQLFLEVSRAATALQLAPEQVDRAMTALAQSFSKGRFQAEELRQQLAEAIPGVVPRFQKAVLEMTKGTDLAGKSFDDLLQGGLLDVKTFLPAMTQAFAEMGASWRDGAQSIQADTNRLANAWRKFNQDAAGGPFGDAAIAGIRSATVALEGLGQVMPVLVPAATSLAALKLGQSALGWVRGLNAAHAATVAQALAAQQASAALVQKTRAEMVDAQATAARARAAYGGSIAADLAAVQATHAHSRALAAHAAASQAAAAASNRLALAGKAALGFFGGPYGLAALAALTAVQWLAFRDNTQDATQALVDWSGAADDAISKFQELNKAQQSGEILNLQKQIRAQTEELNRALNTLGGVDRDTNIVSEADFRLTQEYAAAIRGLQAQWQAGKLTADELANAVDAQNKKLIAGSSDARYFAEIITQQGAAIGTTSRELQVQQGYLDTITGKQRNAAAAARDHASGMVELGRASQEASSKITSAIASLPGQIERIGKSAADVARLDVRDWFRQLAKDGVDFTQQSNEQVKQLMQQGVQYIRLQTRLAAAQKAWEEEQRKSRAGGRESLSLAQQQENQFQSLTDRINRQIALDREAMLVDDKMTAAQRLQVIVTEELKSAKSLLTEAEQERVRALLDEAVAQGSALKAMQDAQAAAESMLRLQNQLAEATRSQRAAQEIDLLGIGRGGEAVEQMRRVLDLQREHQRQVEELNQRYADRETSAAQSKAYAAELALLNQHHEQLLQEEAEYQRRRAEMQGDWVNGFQRAMDDFLERSRDVAGQTYDIFNSAFDGLSDAITDTLHRGSADWEGFLDDINRQILQFIVRQQLSKWMESLFGGSGTASANGGGWAGALWSLFGGGSGGWGWADGGYTGPGGKYEPAGIVHKGEGVLTQAEVASLGGVAGFNALRQALRRGYADGGLVGGSGRVAVGAALEARGPAGPMGGRRMPFQQNLQIRVDGRPDKRTLEQIEAATMRGGRRALARSGG